MFRSICLFVLFTVTGFSATVRLYLKDGTFQLTREYQVQNDRVRYYSTEREEWEEIPLEMVDLDRTKKETVEREATIAADTKAQAEEDAAIRAAEKEVETIPVEPGVYYIHSGKL